jgi:hypothetical protein
MKDVQREKSRASDQSALRLAFAAPVVGLPMRTAFGVYATW